MTTIYRYELEITDRSKLDMPRGAEVLPAPPNPRYAGLIELWAKVDDTQPMETREFLVIGTGNPMPDRCGQFVGTVTDGRFVWHIFEAAA